MSIGPDAQMDFAIAVFNFFLADSQRKLQDLKILQALKYFGHLGGQHELIRTPGY